LGKSYIALAGVALLLLACFIMLLFPVSASNAEITKIRCDLIDSWLKPKGDLLEKHWDKTIGSDCGVGS